VSTGGTDPGERVASLRRYFDPGLHRLEEAGWSSPCALVLLRLERISPYDEQQALGVGEEFARAQALAPAVRCASLESSKLAIRTRLVAVTAS